MGFRLNLTEYTFTYIKGNGGVAPRVKLNNEHLFYGKIFVVTCFCIKIDDNQSSERHW